MTDWTNNPDPLDQPASVPSLSFKDAPIGASYTGIVTRVPNKVHSRDFETNEYAYWDDAHQRPKESVVLNIRIGDGGDDNERSIWALIPSAMYAALADAQKASHKRIDIGDTLTVTYIGDKPNATNPKLNPAKQYTVVHIPADPLAQPNEAPATTGGWTLPPSQSNGHATPPPSSSSAVPPAGPPAAAPALDPEQAMAAINQIKTLIGFGLSDEQIRVTVPSATVEVLAAVRALPVG